MLRARFGHADRCLAYLREHGAVSELPPLSLRDSVRTDLHDALNQGNPKHVKGVLQAMIDGIRVDGRDHIEPTFRVPAVRIESVTWAKLVGAQTRR